MLPEPISLEGELKFSNLESVIAPGATVGNVAEDPKRSPVNWISS